MLKRCVSVKASTPVGFLIRAMATKTCELRGPFKQRSKNSTLCKCNESSTTRVPIRRSSSTNCAENGQGETRDGSKEARVKETGTVQWHKLSEDEKSIYVAHNVACQKGENMYADPVTGYMVFTEKFLLARETCCGNACRHCPYGHENVAQGQRNKTFNSAFYV